MARCYQYSEPFGVTDSMKHQFNEQGYVLVRGIVSKAEVAALLEFFESSPDIAKYCQGRDDGAERLSKLVLWNHPGDDISGMLARSEKIVNTFQELLGGEEIYHYHSKLMMKEAQVGGRHVWHQDYGYWYNNGCLFPNMGSVFIALDPCTKENSCLQILPGSQKMGRVSHVVIENEINNIDSNDGAHPRPEAPGTPGSRQPASTETSKTDGKQVGADLTRVKWAKDRFPLIYVEMEPGDAIFFHSNLLHYSDQNHSKQRRWAMIIAYNQKSNNPLIPHHHPQYTPLAKVSNSAIIYCENKASTTDKWWIEAQSDLSSLKNK